MVDKTCSTHDEINSYKILTGNTQANRPPEISSNMSKSNEKVRLNGTEFEGMAATGSD